MSKVLVKFESNYADEFDVKGFAVFEKQGWENHLKDLEALPEDLWPQSRSFGTNEGIEWDSFEEYRRCFTVQDISEDEFKTIKKHLFNYGNVYGIFLDIEEIPDKAYPLY